MFEKKKSFSWKIPALILLGVVVVGSGVFFGIKLKNTLQVAQEPQTQSREVFALNENCEIWIQGQIASDGSYESPKMLGTIPKDLLNKTRDEIVAYLTREYPNREVISMNENEIILCNTQNK